MAAGVDGGANNGGYGCEGGAPRHGWCRDEDGVGDMPILTNTRKQTTPITHSQKKRVPLIKDLF